MMEILFWVCIAGICYVYFGYPLLIAFIAGRIKYSSGKISNLPKVTLIIPAYNEESVIAKKLVNCFGLVYPREKMKILVVADGSKDRTVEIVQSFQARGVKLLYSPERRGKTAAINRAVASADSEIVVFSDANNMYDPAALKELISPFDDDDVGAVSGAKVILKGNGALGASEGLYWKYESFIKKRETCAGCCTCLVGEIYAVRRSLLPEWPQHIINDDSYIALKLLQLGVRIVYAEKARSFEHSSAHAEDEIERRSRIIAGRLQILALLGTLMPWRRPFVSWALVSHKFLRPFVPFALFGALATNFSLVFLPTTEIAGREFFHGFFYLTIFCLQVVFYAIAVTANRFQGNRILEKIVYLPKFLVNSNYAALIGWYRFIFNKQTPLWKQSKRTG